VLAGGTLGRLGSVFKGDATLLASKGFADLGSDEAVGMGHREKPEPASGVFHLRGEHFVRLEIRIRIKLRLL
jgi:hypothetical protein